MCTQLRNEPSSKLTQSSEFSINSPSPPPPPTPPPPPPSPTEVCLLGKMVVIKIDVVEFAGELKRVGKSSVTLKKPTKYVNGIPVQEEMDIKINKNCIFSIKEQ